MVNLQDHSPAARLAVLKEGWPKLSDVDVFDAIRETAEECAKGSLNSEAWHYLHILQQLGISLPRPRQIPCPKCGNKINAKG